VLRPKELAVALVMDFDGRTLSLAHLKGRPGKVSDQLIVGSNLIPIAEMLSFARDNCLAAGSRCTAGWFRLFSGNGELIIITHRFKLDKILDAYDTFGHVARTQALKVIIEV